MRRVRVKFCAAGAVRRRWQLPSRAPPQEDVVRILAGARDARRLRLDRRRRNVLGSTPAPKALVRLLPRVYDEADDVETIVEAPPAPRREPTQVHAAAGTPMVRTAARRRACASSTVAHDAPRRLPPHNRGPVDHGGPTPTPREAPRPQKVNSTDPTDLRSVC